MYCRRSHVAASLGTYVPADPQRPVPTATPYLRLQPPFCGMRTGVLVSLFLVLADNTRRRTQDKANALIEGFSGALQNELDSIQRQQRQGDIRDPRFGPQVSIR